VAVAKLSIVWGYLLLHLGWIGVQIGTHYSGGSNVLNPMEKRLELSSLHLLLRHVH